MKKNNDLGKVSVSFKEIKPIEILSVLNSNYINPSFIHISAFNLCIEKITLLAKDVFNIKESNKKCVDLVKIITENRIEYIALAYWNDGIIYSDKK